VDQCALVRSGVAAYGVDYSVRAKMCAKVRASRGVKERRRA